jgi:hypothetical protein
MLLHRYFNSHAFETLKRAKLKTSRISSFNDSFEFLYFPTGKKLTPEEVQKNLPALLGNPTFRAGLKAAIEKESYPVIVEEIEELLLNNPQAVCELVSKIWPDIVEKTVLPIERRRQIVDRELRAICFSDPSRVVTQEEILLWSHYAKRNEGIRIGFEFPDGITDPFRISEITYEENRVEVVFSIGGEEPTLKALEKSATVKCKVWKYEKEFRLFTKVNHCKPEELTNCDSTKTLEHFLDFNREWVKFVDFGVFCPESEVHRIMTLLKTDYPNAVARRAEFHKTEYALEYKQVQ